MEVFIYLREFLESTMGIHSLNNAFNMAALWKTMKSGQPTKTVAPSKPVELTKNGSIFNSQNSQNTQKTQSQQPENTKNSQVQTSGFSVGEGKEKAASAKGMMAQAKAGKAVSERNSSIMDKISAQSKTLQANTQASQKTMQAAMREGQAKLDQNNARMQKLTADLMKEKAEINAIQNRLEMLTSGGITGSGGSVYSLKLAGDTDPAFGASGVNSSGGGGSGNDAEIESLTAKLGSKTAKVTVYSKQMNKIQTSSGKAIRTMSKASRNYQKTVKQSQTQADQFQSTATKVANVTDKVNEIAMYTTLAGKGVEMFSQGMRALGERMVSSQNPTTAAAGAAMISASVPMEETGIVVQTVGTYTSTAASLTKSICQMADGDISGAIQSLTAAATTVTAAIQSSMTMKDSFENISKQADNAMQSGLEKQMAKKLSADNKEQMKKAGSSDNQIKQAGDQPSIDSKKGVSLDDQKTQLSSDNTADNTVKNSDGNNNDIKAAQQDATPKSVKHKVQKGENWYNIVKQEYGITDHKAVMEVVHQLKDIAGPKYGKDAKYNNKMMPKEITLPTSMKLQNGTSINLANVPDESVQTARELNSTLKTIKSDAYIHTEEKKADDVLKSLNTPKTSTVNKADNKSITKTQDKYSKAQAILDGIGKTLMAAGTVAGLTMALSQPSSKPTAKAEHHRSKGNLNINVKHSYMKELAHMKKMARAEAAQNRRG